MVRICATSMNETINLNSNKFNDVVNNFYDWLPRPCEAHIRPIRLQVPLHRATLDVSSVEAPKHMAVEVTSTLTATTI